jgi:hypothetical protein
VRNGYLLLLFAILSGCGGGGGGGKRASDADADGVADAQDCAPSDASRWQNLSFQSIDSDADGRRVNSGGQLCAGSSLPASRSTSTVTASDADCNDNLASVWRDAPYAARDVDSDGFSVVASGTVCAGNDLPAGFGSTAPASASIDCDDNLASVWRDAPYAARDVDSDGFSVVASGRICTGNALPAGFGSTAPASASIDCDDSTASIWQLRMTYSDADADGVGAGAGMLTCMGATAPPTRSLLGYDPVDDPNDPTSATVSNLELEVWQLSTP